MTLGEKIRELRKETGLSQAVLESRSGVYALKNIIDAVIVKSRV